MDDLYCLSLKEEDEYCDHSIYTSFENALVTIYDIALNKFGRILRDLGPEQSTKYIEDLKDINSLRKDYKPDKVTYLFDRRFRITRVKNLLTSKVAFENIINHINQRFVQLKNLKTNKKICFPLEIFDERLKSKWYTMDEYNAGEVIQELEKYVQRKIDLLKLQNIDVIQGILERNNDDFIAVRFTDSQEFLLNKEIFSITISPNTGYDRTLTTSQPQYEM